MKIEKSVFPDNNKWLSPNEIITRFNLCLKKYGTQKVLSDGRFKKIREMWVTAAYLLALNQITGFEHWGKPVYDTAPDSHGLHFEPHPMYPDSDRGYILQIEVSEWVPYSKISLSDTILEKLRNKNYPLSYVLLMHITRINEAIDLENVFKALKNNHIPVSEIWCISSHAGRTKDNYLLTRLYPDRVWYEYSLGEEIKKYSNQVPIIEVVKSKKRGITGYGNTEFSLPDL